MKTGYYKLPLGAVQDEKKDLVDRGDTHKNKKHDDVRKSLLLAAVLDDNMLDALLAVEPYLEPDIKIAVNSALKIKGSASELSDSVNIRYAVEKAGKRGIRSQAEVLHALSKSRFARDKGLANNLGKAVDFQDKFAKFNGSRDFSPLLLEMVSARFNNNNKSNSDGNNPAGNKNMDIANVMSMLRGTRQVNPQPMLTSGNSGHATNSNQAGDKQDASNQDRTMDILKLMSMLKMGSGGMDINSILPLVDMMRKKD